MAAEDSSSGLISHVAHVWRYLKKRKINWLLGRGAVATFSFGSTQPSTLCNSNPSKPTVDLRTGVSRTTSDIWRNLSKVVFTCAGVSPCGLPSSS
jgi:hypothetical protein